MQEVDYCHEAGWVIRCGALFYGLIFLGYYAYKYHNELIKNHNSSVFKYLSSLSEHEYSAIFDSIENPHLDIYFDDLRLTSCLIQLHPQRK